MTTKAFLCNEMQKRFSAEYEKVGINIGMGYANGYVAVSPGHPLYGLDYNKVYDVTKVDVWGGLTLATSVSDFMPSADNIEMIGGGSFDDIPKDWWLFGFDTMHCDDGPHHDREWCIRETKLLQQQLEAFTDKTDKSV